MTLISHAASRLPLPSGRAITGLCLFASAVLLAAPRPAHACNFRPYPEAFAVNPPSPATVQPPTAPTFVKAEIVRSEHAPPGTGDCADVGSIQLHFELAGAAWPDNLGIRLRPVAGTLPSMVQIPDNPLQLGGGIVVFTGADDPSLPIDFTLQVTTVDEYGNESAPITVHVTSPAKSSSGGCSLMTTPRTAPVCVAALVALLLLGLSRARARARIRRCSCPGSFRSGGLLSASS